MTDKIFATADDLLPDVVRSSTMRRAIDGFDWQKTPLGAIGTWPEALSNNVRLMLTSRTPMAMLIGREGILLFNDAYQEFAGPDFANRIGLPAVEAWPEAAAFNQDIVERLMRGERLRFSNIAFELNRPGKPPKVYLDLDYAPIVDAHGSILGGYAIMVDQTDRVDAEISLARSKEHLSFALEAAGIVGTWDWQIQPDIVTADRRFAEMYGVDPAEASRGTAIGRFIEGVHPDDRAILGASINEAIAQLSGFRCEYRLGSGDDVRWVLAVGRAFADDRGQAARLPGVTIDITDRKAIETALTESEAKFRAIADTMPQMVWSTLPDGYHDYYNARWYEYTGVPPGSTDGAEWNGMFHPDDQERAWTAWRHSLATGMEYEIEYRLRHRSGQYRWTLGRALPVRDRDGTIVRWFGTCTDIHEAKLAAVERELVAQELSHRIKNIFSVLTGLIALAGRARPEIAPVVEELRQRIKALGRAHDFVRPHSSSSRPERINTTLHALIGELLAPYGHVGSRVTINGDDLAVDDRAATPLALLFHELGTNAAKYGAFHSDRGTLAITTRAHEDQCEIIWREMVPGASTGGKGDGFGSRLMTLSVEAQMGGKLSREWTPQGLLVTIAVPIRSLTRDVQPNAIQLVS